MMSSAARVAVVSARSAPSCLTSTMTMKNDPSSFVQSLRESAGQCPSCGQQLYQMVAESHSSSSSSSLLPWTSSSRNHHSNHGRSASAPHRIPLTIPQLVERGQCVPCTSGRSASSLNSLGDWVLTTGSGSTAAAARPAPTATDRSGSTSSLSCAAVYEGPFNEMGQKHGVGEMQWANGDVYKGAFVNDVRHGHGTLTFGPTAATASSAADNGEYVGEWRNNQMHGNGTRRYPNGDVYMGEYYNGKRQGEGRFYYANGDMYWGKWENNMMQGEGRYYYANGQRFEGTFRNSKRNGKGKLQRTDGALDIFQYINDQRVGQGVRWSQDRTKAWRLWSPTGASSGRTGQSGCGTMVLEKQKITIAEAVSLVYEIEQAAMNSQGGNTMI